MREEIAYLVPKTISICFYSVNTSFDRLDCLGRGKKKKKYIKIFNLDPKNNIYYLEWKFLRKNERGKKNVPNLKNARIFKISMDTIKSIELMQSSCKSMICLLFSKIYKNKRDFFKYFSYKWNC